MPNERRRPPRRARQCGVSRSLMTPPPAAAVAAWVRQVETAVGAYMADIAAMFHPGAKITVLVRHPTDNEGDMCITDDEFPDMIAMLHRCQARDAGGVQ